MSISLRRFFRLKERIDRLIYSIWLFLGRFCKASRLDHVKVFKKSQSFPSCSPHTEGGVTAERTMPVDLPWPPRITEGAVLEMTVQEDGVIYDYDFLTKTVTIENFLRHDVLRSGD